MAKIVIAGCSDCPYYAKVELLADLLRINVPNFFVHKILKTREEWNMWVGDLAKFNAWNVKESPIIWRELVDRGGKGNLIGGPNEFQEYVRCYYNVKSDLLSMDMLNIAEDNIRFKEEEDNENREFKAMSTPTKICICGATNEAVPHFILSLANGSVLGEDVEISLVLLDQTQVQPTLKGLQMGIFDLAFPLVRSISISDDPMAAIIDSSLVIVFESQLSEIETEDKIISYDKIQEYYEMLGDVVEKHSPPEVKVLVVPSSPISPLNIILTVIHRELDRIPRFSIVGLAKPLENHARAVLANKLSVNPSNVHNIIIWGNLGGKVVIDISHAQVCKYDGAVVGPDPFSLPVTTAIWDHKWLDRGPMETDVTDRFNKIKELRDSSGNWLHLANSICTTLRMWLYGDQTGHIHSLVVAATEVGNSYGVPAGTVFSMPVTMNPGGYWSIVEDIELNEEQFKKIGECIEEQSQKLQLLYPWMNQNNQNIDSDNNSVEGQIRSLLEEIVPKGDRDRLWILLKDSLSADEKLQVSKNKDFLITTLEELQKSLSKTKSNLDFENGCSDSLENLNSNQKKIDDNIISEKENKEIFNTENNEQ